MTSSENPCSCITRDRFHLVITYADQSAIVLQDRSQWVDDPGFLRPGVFTLKITDPNDNTTSVTVNTDGAVLGQPELTRPVVDGVYKFTVPAMGVGCGIEQTQEHYLWPNLRCRLMKARLRVKNTLQKDVEDIADIIQVMQAAANFGDQDRTDELYRIATLKLDALDCDCKCTK